MEHGGSVNPCDVDISILHVFIFVLVCGGYASETIYPAEIAMSTGAF